MNRLPQKLIPILGITMLIAAILIGCVGDKFNLDKLAYDSDRAFAFPLSDASLDVYDLCLNV